MGCSLYLLSLGIFTTAWMLDFAFLPRIPPTYNYDSEVYFAPDMYIAPSSKNELADILKSLSRASSHGSKRKVRVVGSGHSWSSIAKSEEIQLSMAEFKGMVSVNKTTNQVTFGAGTTLHEANAILDEMGLALPVLGSISDQTVGGAISTGTHGTGIKYGNMATIVTKLELITGNGEILTLHSNDTSDPFLFKSAQVSLGLLGVITEVTIQCVPSFNLEETVELHTLRCCIRNFDDLVKGSDHVKLWVELFSETCIVTSSNRTTEEPRGNPSWWVGLVKNIVSEGLLVAGAWFPSTVPSLMKFLFQYGRPVDLGNRVDVSHRVFNIPYYFAHHYESELVVGVGHCPRALELLQELVYREWLPVNYIVEVRFVKADSIPLSPEYEQDSCRITLCIVNASVHNRERYFNGFFAALAKAGLNPRLHWGKSFNLTFDEVSGMYSSLSRFLSIREKLDDQKLFVNSLLGRTFGL